MIISNKLGLQQPHMIHYGRLELNITLMTMKGVTCEKLDVKVERKKTQYKEASPSQLASLHLILVHSYSSAINRIQQKKTRS